MSDKQIKHLIKKRAIIKGKLTGFSSYLKSLANSKQTDELQTQIELQLRLDRIESLYDDFDAFQSELDELSDMPEDEAREREAFYSQYYSLVSAGRALIQSHSKLSPPAQDTVSPVCSEVHSHRPENKVDAIAGDVEGGCLGCDKGQVQSTNHVVAGANSSSASG
ncbi:uncharacterized protein LOC123668986 isoform X3 [Melitaea cinxia]|uniref:uncharacterized protein LOC123661244 isoform X4 n=1 Tax=Melitaea cinxia TaxID=113334 RepID=UPI001E274178|nr:uncharacterized protein LOC123661244 isoform X4 [Melitaea cinxia]XP_045458637.1 uncharacterized protein LOC123668986 isoform X3 [Melitaea cinxia]